MYINLKLFGKALYLSLFTCRFSLRRWAYIGFFTALYWVMWLLVALGRALDHLLFPGFRQQPIIRPVFIVAPPRSGTTRWLQRNRCVARGDRLRELKES